MSCVIFRPAERNLDESASFHGLQDFRCEMFAVPLPSKLFGFSFANLMSTGSQTNSSTPQTLNHYSSSKTEVDMVQLKFKLLSGYWEAAFVPVQEIRSQTLVSLDH